MTGKELLQALKDKRDYGSLFRKADAKVKKAKSTSDPTSLMRSLPEGEAAIDRCGALRGETGPAPESIPVVLEDGSSLIIKHHKWAESERVDRVVAIVKEMLIEENVLRRDTDKSRRIERRLNEIQEETHNVPVWGAIWTLPPTPEEETVSEGSRTLIIEDD